MTADEITRLVAHVEQLWRSRTPPTSVHEMLPSYRVGRAEIWAWCNDNGIRYDELDEECDVAMTKMFLRLRREFPAEKWDAPNAHMKELCKKYKLRIPKTS